MLYLIWVQTVWHSDGIPERIFFEKVNFEKKEKKKKLLNVKS